MKMRAAFREKYVDPDGLKIATVDRPEPKSNEILVRVRATTVSRTDTAVLSGKPFVMRFFTGLMKPTSPIPGTDFSGIVEGIGTNVTKFKVGDRVMGFRDEGLSSHAEYLTWGEDEAIVKIADHISYAQAAASMEGAHYAINFLNKVTLKAGEKVLVNGATGGIGSAALQMLKAEGIEVVAVGNTKNLSLLKSLGADRVIDYLKEDFTKEEEEYPFIFDAVGKSRFVKCKPQLSSNGVYLSSELGPRAENPFLALWTPIFRGKKVIFPIPSDIKKSLSIIKKLLDEEKFKPVIDRVHPLEEIAEAYTFVNTGEKTGNVVISYGLDID